MQIPNKIKGFTLIELIAVMVISSIIALITAKIISAQLNSVVTSTNLINADAQARVALERMAREIRNIPSPSNLSSTSNTSQLVFVDSNSNTITISRSGSSLMRNSDVLADGIQNLTFTYYDKNGAVITPPPTALTTYIKITIVVTIQSSTFTASTSIYMRNAD